MFDGQQVLARGKNTVVKHFYKLSLRVEHLDAHALTSLLEHIEGHAFVGWVGIHVVVKQGSSLANTGRE